ncbi:MAG: outer membrane lipoprotein-sorting protein, partial [Gammaproteobacteria bacterium]
MKFFILLVLTTNLAFADDKGLEIAREVEARDSGWGNFVANMKMILTDRKGRSAVREIRTKNLEVDGDGDKSMSIFDTPRDIKGTAMLTFSHKLDMDDQWLYLPALKRVKRISSRNKSGPFMGSEFAYEDLGSQEVEKYEYIYLGEDQLNGVSAFKSKRVPRYKHTGYKKQIIWIDKDRYIPLRI